MLEYVQNDVGTRQKPWRLLAASVAEEDLFSITDRTYWPLIHCNRYSHDGRVWLRASHHVIVGYVHMTP